jgi:hypothetical protein
VDVQAGARARWRRVGVSLVASLAVLAISGASALADTELSRTGKVGKRSLTEPGAACNYNGSGILWSFLVNPPKIYARNTTAGPDLAHVAWRFAVKRWVAGDAKWTSIYRSGRYNGTASDTEPANFSYQYGYPKIPEDTQIDGSAYYVVIKLFWYDSDGVIVGRSTRRVDSYAETKGSELGLTAPECYWTYREAV